MKMQLIYKLISALIFAAVTTTAFCQKAVMVNSSNSTLVYPTNFWSVNAVLARSGLGLGTAATNNSTAFQASSAVLSNLSSSNAVNLTNVQASNIVGVISASNIPSTTLSNISGTLAVVSGGTGATNISGARTNLGLGASWLTNTTESNFRSAIGLPLAALTNTNEANFRTAIGLGATSSVSIQNLTAQTYTVSAGGGIVLQSLLTNAPSFRTNIGLGAVWLTNTDLNTFKSTLGVGTNSSAYFQQLNIKSDPASTTNFTLATFTNGYTSFGINILATDEDLGVGYALYNAPSGSIGNGGGTFQV